MKKKLLSFTCITILFIFVVTSSCVSDGATKNTNRKKNKLDTSGSEDTWTPGEGWNLVWADEFNASIIDTDNWSYQVGGEEHGWWNNEWQIYTDKEENSFIHDGKLVIQALETTGGEFGYTSARMVTKDKQSFKYGKIAARMKLPFGQGIWPALWMMGQSYDDLDWPACGEIDIMEMIGGNYQEDTVYSTSHWYNDSTAKHKYDATYLGGSYTLYDGRTFSDDYHVYEIEWDSEKIISRVDGEEYYTFDVTGPNKTEFHEDFFILVNLAVGGDWPKYPDATTIFPQYLCVDWIRVYQQ